MRKKAAASMQLLKGEYEKSMKKKLFAISSELSLFSFDGLIVTGGYV